MVYSHRRCSVDVYTRSNLGLLNSYKLKFFVFFICGFSIIVHLAVMVLKCVSVTAAYSHLFKCCLSVSENI